MNSSNSTKDSDWAQALWNRADAFDTPAEQLPRSQDTLLNPKLPDHRHDLFTHLSLKVTAFLRSAPNVYAREES